MKFVVLLPTYTGVDKDTFSFISDFNANDCGDINGCRIAETVISVDSGSTSRRFTSFTISIFVSPLFSILIKNTKSATSIISPNVHMSR